MVGINIIILYMSCKYFLSVKLINGTSTRLNNLVFTTMRGINTSIVSKNLNCIKYNIYILVYI